MHKSKADSLKVESPLSGYQYAQVHVAGASDPDFVYLAGSLYCPAFDNLAVEYTETATFNATETSSKSYYEALGNTLLRDVLEADAWDYTNAYAIWDYLNYQDAHNTTAAALMSQPQLMDVDTNASYLEMIKWYADEQQYAQLGNLIAQNDYSGSDTAWPDDITGSLSTIAGNLLAAKLLSQLQIAVDTEGEYYKLSVLVGDFEPLVSFFALTGLPELNAYYYGLPDFGSIVVFELFSWVTNSSTPTFPDPGELFVRFYFRNGTAGSDNNGAFQAYPIFHRGPSETDMTWNDFQAAMTGISMGDVGDWCTQCSATNIFCAAWNSSITLSDSSNTTSSTSGQSGLKPAVAGVIGAIMGLFAAAFVFAGVMALTGLRFHRVQNRAKSEMGGFKGGQKMASDPDLTMSKGRAVVGATVERGPDSPISPIGHERVGSWELKQAETGLPNIAAPEAVTRPSFEEDDEAMDPYHQRIAKPDERV